jgi:hypothetical protein
MPVPFQDNGGRSRCCGLINTSSTSRQSSSFDFNHQDPLTTRLTHLINMMLSNWVLPSVFFFSHAVFAATTKCSGAVGTIASNLSGYGPAQTFCSSKFPVPKVTSTVTSTTSSSIEYGPYLRHTISYDVSLRHRWLVC